MRTISVGIFAEGPTDYDFFSPLIVRLTSELASALSPHPVQIADPLQWPGRPSNAGFRSITSAQAAVIDVLLVHTDGAGDNRRAIRERIDPWKEIVRHLFDGRRRVFVPIVPVRETEAWMLCDVDALNRTFGAKREAEELSLPRHPKQVEQVQDPKLKLQSIQIRIVGKRAARRIGVRPLYARLGHEVSLRMLRQLPAFAQFEEDFCDALTQLGFLEARD